MGVDSQGAHPKSVWNAANDSWNTMLLFTSPSSISQHNSSSLASFSPPSGTCLLPLSLQPTNVCCSLSCCPGSRMLLDKWANLGDHGNSGFPQSTVVRSPLAARPHSPSSPFPLLLHPCAHRESWAWEPERSPLSKDHQMQLKMKNLMDQMD